MNTEEISSTKKQLIHGKITDSQTHNIGPLTLEIEPHIDDTEVKARSYTLTVGFMDQHTLDDWSASRLEMVIRNNTSRLGNKIEGLVKGCGPSERKANPDMKQSITYTETPPGKSGGLFGIIAEVAMKEIPDEAILASARWMKTVGNSASLQL